MWNKQALYTKYWILCFVKLLENIGLDDAMNIELKENEQCTYRDFVSGNLSVFCRRKWYSNNVLFSWVSPNMTKGINRFENELFSFLTASDELITFSTKIFRLQKYMFKLFAIIKCSKMYKHKINLKAFRLTSSSVKKLYSFLIQKYIQKSFFLNSLEVNKVAINKDRV